MIVKSFVAVRVAGCRINISATIYARLMQVKQFYDSPCTPCLLQATTGLTIQCSCRVRRRSHQRTSEVLPSEDAAAAAPILLQSMMVVLRVHEPSKKCRVHVVPDAGACRKIIGIELHTPGFSRSGSSINATTHRDSLNDCLWVAERQSTPQR